LSTLQKVKVRKYRKINHYILNIKNKTIQVAIKYVKNTLWMISEKVVKIIFAIILARFLGSESYGILMYAYSFVFIFSPLSSLGLDTVTEKYLVSQPEKERSYLGTVFTLKILGSLLALVGIIITWTVLDTELDEKLLIGILSLSFLFQQLTVFELFFRANVLAKYISYAKFAGLLVKGVVLVYLLYSSKSLIWFASTYIIDAFIVFISSLILYSKKKKVSSGLFFDFKLAKILLRESFPLMFAGIAIVIYSRIDQLMLKHFLTDSDVGVYATAVQLAESWYFIPVAIGTSLFPAIVKAKEKSEKLYYQTLHYFSGLNIAFAFFAVFLFIFFGEFLILLLYGKDFTSGATVLSIYCASGIFTAMGAFWSKWVLIENLQKYQFYMQVGAAIFNIILNLLFIPIWGKEGAAIATVVSYSGGFIVTGLITSKLRRMTGMMLIAILTFGIYPFVKYKFLKKI